MNVCNILLITMQSEPLLLGKSHVYHHNLPYVAHKRLVHYTHMPAPTPHNSVRNSVINNEIDRIQHRSRPHFSHVPTEDYLNSRAVVNFDDDVRNIRAHTAALLKRVQSPIPRAARMPLSSAFDHIETAIPDRITSDAYISTMLSPRNVVDRTVQKMCQYPEIHEKAYNNIGKGRLACVSFAGGKAYPRRRHIMVSGNGSDETRNVKADINFLSYYKGARDQAEEVATHEVPLYTNYRRSPEPYTPRSYYRLIRPYKPTKSAPAKVEVEQSEDAEEDETPKRTKKSVSRQATIDKEAEEASKREAEEAAIREQEEEAKRIAEELEREEAERKEKVRLAREARLAEEKAEEERLAKAREEEERLLAEIAEQERIAAEKAEREERLAAERAEEERLAAEEELLAAEKAESERLAFEEQERQRIEAERIEEERLEAERIEAEKEAEEERILAAQAEEQRYAQDQGRMDEERLAAELTENLLRIKAEKEREEAEEEEDNEVSENDRAATEEPEESKKEDEYVSDEDNDKAVAESSEEEDETKDELGDEGHPIVEYPATPDVTGNERKNLIDAEEITSTEEEEEEEE